ncbi:hypothetical protein FNV43_RR05983 [Rhamnella rubrinervis]|uniref:MADS-box domain-containing protein n=1 Tax=Rhamnella rubrinervis TaxID=2594499 RepID=A0A8K0HD06_9ROSA|nr:hypothetical protein FNV43_RR05983 [Rhamnella rubrinervis]
MEGIKKTRGRQKIEMKLIKNEEDRSITFSKRKSGIFKKASEISTLCGAQVGVVIFSSSGKPLSYANPSIDSLANRFLNQLEEDDETHPLVEIHRQMRLEKLNKEYNQLKTDLEAVKEKGKELKRLAKERGEEKGWWEAPIDELGVEEVEELMESIEDFHLVLTNHLAERACSNKNGNKPLHGGAAGTSGQGNNNSNSPFVIDAKENDFDLFF